MRGSLLALGVLTACRPSYDEARAACGYAPDQYLPPFRAMSWGDPDAGISNRYFMGMSRNCAVTMGRALNLNWGSLQSEPRALTDQSAPQDAGSSIALGMAFLVATDFGSVEDFQRFKSSPPSLQRFLDRPLRRARPDDRMGEILYEAILDSIDEVEGEHLPKGQPLIAFYDHGVVSFSPDWTEPSSVIAGERILHEALHSQAIHRLSCRRLANAAYTPEGGQYGPTFEDCDRTMDSVNGGVATMYWLAAHAMRDQVMRAYNADEIDIKEKSEFNIFILDILYEGQTACRNICEVGDSPACAETRNRRIEKGEGVCEMQGDIPVFVNRTKEAQTTSTSPL